MQWTAIGGGQVEICNHSCQIFLHIIYAYQMRQSTSMLDANLAIGISIGLLITVNFEATTSKKRQVRRTTVIVVCSPGSTSNEEIAASRGGEQ